MSTFRSSLIVGSAILLGSLSAAGAADLGSVKDSYVSAAPAAPSSLYVRLDGGYAGHNDPDMTEDGIWDLTNTSIDETWTLGGGIGRYFTPSIRGDITYDHRFEADAEGHLTDCCAPLPGVRSFGIESDVVLANVYYDFDRGSRFSPYVGVGLGVAYNKTTKGTVSNECGCQGEIAEGDDTNVAAALMAGATLRLRGGEPAVYGGIKDGPVAAPSGRNLYLDVGYRFLYLGDVSTGEVTMVDGNGSHVSNDPTVEDIHAHELRFGLRYDLN